MLEGKLCSAVITEQHNDDVQGMAGTWDELKAKELVLALTNHDLFLYLGHGSGMPYTDKSIFIELYIDGDPYSYQISLITVELTIMFSFGLYDMSACNAGLVIS